MHCIEWVARSRTAAALQWGLRSTLWPMLCAVWLAGCGAWPSAEPVAAPGTDANPPTSSMPVPPPATSSAVGTARVPSTAMAPALRLPPPAAVRTAVELKLQAARRIVAANPQLTYADAAPDALLAIPVLSVELNVDGSVRRIDVMRQPRQATDTTQIAIDAVRRAAPFGNVSRLPKPWRFTETFLFNEARQFKPRTLDN